MDSGLTKMRKIKENKTILYQIIYFIREDLYLLIDILKRIYFSRWDAHLYPFVFRYWMYQIENISYLVRFV